MADEVDREHRPYRKKVAEPFGGRGLDQQGSADENEDKTQHKFKSNDGSTGQICIGTKTTYAPNTAYKGSRQFNRSSSDVLSTTKPLRAAWK
jgi:hypothetical protein